MTVLCEKCGHNVPAPVGNDGNPELSMNTATIVRGSTVRFTFLCQKCADAV